MRSGGIRGTPSPRISRGRNYVRRLPTSFGIVVVGDFISLATYVFIGGSVSNSIRLEKEEIISYECLTR